MRYVGCLCWKTVAACVFRVPCIPLVASGCQVNRKKEISSSIASYDGNKCVCNKPDYDFRVWSQVFPGIFYETSRKTCNFQDLDSRIGRVVAISLFHFSRESRATRDDDYSFNGKYDNNQMNDYFFILEMAR